MVRIASRLIAPGSTYLLESYCSKLGLKLLPSFVLYSDASMRIDIAQPNMIVPKASDYDQEAVVQE